MSIKHDVPCILLLELKKKFSSSNFLHLTLAKNFQLTKNIFPSGPLCARDCSSITHQVVLLIQNASLLES